MFPTYVRRIVRQFELLIKMLGNSSEYIFNAVQINASHIIIPCDTVRWFLNYFTFI